jgi:hypothetical protein
LLNSSRCTLVAFLASVLTAASISSAATTGTVLADSFTISNDPARDGWDPNEPGLSPSFVGSGQFGQIFSTPVSGQQYAQPLVVGSDVIVSTMHNIVYRVNGTSGSVVWQRQIGTPEPASVIGCSAVTDAVGILSTPVYDPVANIVYVMARTWDGVNASSAQYTMHALNETTGAEMAGWPVTIAGSASNDSSIVFNPVVQNQRPGVLLLGGFVYAAFASWCDAGNYKGWVSSVSTGNRAVHLWTSEATPPVTNNFGGIWQSGGGLMSDGPGRIFVAVGNGDPPNPGPGTVSQPTMGEAVVRLNAASDGTVSHADHFSPFNASDLNVTDLDLGSGGPVALPDSMGVANHPHLLLQGSKSGVVYLLDRDALGGRAQGPGGGNLDVAETRPLGAGVYSHAAVWPGDGGYIYLSADNEYVLQISTNGGAVTVSVVAAFAYSTGYRQASSVVTSNGSQSGSALVWSYVQPINGGPGAELRAHLAVPDGTGLPLLWRAPVGEVNKFANPVTSGGKVYAGTFDGHLIGFGAIPNPWKITVPLSGGTTSTFNSLTAISANDVWAVGSFKDGSGSNSPMTEHWDGSRWNMVVPPKGGASSVFSAVAAVARNDVWAVGSYQEGAGKTWPLTEHWDGASWNVLVPPRGGASSTLSGVSALSSTDVWAVGSYNDAGGHSWPLTYHWNGGAWSVVVPPAGGAGSTLISVMGAATGDIWAVGSYSDTFGNTWPLAEHWNGVAWTINVPPAAGSSSAFSGVQVLAGNDVWAVGWYMIGGVKRPLAEHWNGSAWSVTIGLVGGASSVFTSVAAVSSSDVWAAGTYFDAAGSPRPLAQHWDGLQWNMVLPVVGGTGSTFAGIVAIASNSLWSVGSFNDSAGIVYPLAERYAS